MRRRFRIRNPKETVSFNTPMVGKKHLLRVALEDEESYQKITIDLFKEKLESGLDVEPFVIPCFDPNVNYKKEPIRFTYPVKCK